MTIIFQMSDDTDTITVEAYENGFGDLTIVRKHSDLTQGHMEFEKQDLINLRDALLARFPLPSSPQTTVEKLGEMSSLTSTANAVTINLTGDNLTINLSK